MSRCDTCGNEIGTRGNKIDGDLVFLADGAVAYRLLLGGWRVIPKGVANAICAKENDEGPPNSENKPEPQPTDPTEREER